MPKKVEIPVEEKDGKTIEPIQVMMDATTQVDAGELADLKLPSEEDDCCPVKLHLAFAGAGMGMHLDHIFKVRGFWNTDLEKYQYKLIFDPWQKYFDVMQGFVDYVHAIYPCVTRISSNWSLAEGNFGPGHTTRRRALTFWTSFDAGGGGVMNRVSNPAPPADMWEHYFENPVNEGSLGGATADATRGLDFNENYHISHGTWLDKQGDCDIPRERECLQEGNFTNFNFRTSAGPL